MRNSTSWLRYTIAIVALLAGLLLSIRWSERGLLLESPGASALTSNEEDGSDWDLDAMRVFNQVLLQIRTDYVDPERTDAQQMLVHAIDRIQNSVPEVVALFDRDIESDPTEVSITVGEETRDWDLTTVTNNWQMAFMMREVFGFLERTLDPEETDFQDLEYAAVNGMLSTLDPHSSLLSPRIYEEMQASNRGSFGGLGIVISIRDAQLTVISPMANTPAGRAGFQAGDRIVKINDESTINMPLDEAVNRLRGVPGSTVTVEIMRDGWLEPHVFELTREIINIESVDHHPLGDRVGYIAIRNFQGNTHDDMLAALRDLREEMGGLNGLVLDLRNDPGGLLNQAIRVVDTFISEGTIVTTVGVGDRLRDQTSATSRNTEPNYPIVVLVNSGSASASEIVAGALKAHNRAIVIGDTTFGKGSVQNIYPYRDGSALKLTVAQYLTPGDVSIQGVGIVPDIRIVPASITDESVDIYPSDLVLREGDLESSLTSERVRDTSERPAAVVRYYREVEEGEDTSIRDPNEFEIDFEIDLARQILAAADGIFERTSLLAQSDRTISDVRDEQMRQIQEQLRQRNVDWSAGPNVIQPVSVAFNSDRSENRVSAGESLEVTVSVTNEGEEPLHRVRAVTRSDYGLLDDREFVFGKLEPGQTRSWSLNVEVPLEDPSRIDTVTTHVWADGVDLQNEIENTIRIDGNPRPHWGISWWIDDREEGNGDGMLQVGETVHFNVLLQNTGAGDAQETVAYIRNQSDAAIFLHEGRVTFETIPTEATRLASFRFEVRDIPEGGAIELDAEVLDTVYREFLSESLEIPVLEEGNVVAPRTGVATVTARSAPIMPQPTTDAEAIANAPRGASLEVDGALDGWYRVTWGEDRVGWLSEGGATFDDGRTSARGGAEPSLQYQAPTIDLELDRLAVRSPLFTLRGVVSDESSVRDYYIFVNSRVSDNGRRQTSKRAYEAVGSSSATIQQDLELLPGNNVITVIARDDERITSSATLNVYRYE